MTLTAEWEVNPDHFNILNKVTNDLKIWTLIIMLNKVKHYLETPNMAVLLE